MNIEDDEPTIDEAVPLILPQPRVVRLPPQIFTAFARGRINTVLVTGDNPEIGTPVMLTCTEPRGLQVPMMLRVVTAVQYHPSSNLYVWTLVPGDDLTTARMVEFCLTRPEARAMILGGLEGQKEGSNDD